MKKLSTLLLVLGVLGATMLAGCGDKATDTTAGSTEQTTATTTVSTEQTTVTSVQTTETSAQTTETSAPSGEKFYLRWAQFSTANLPTSAPYAAMAENITKRTDGRCKVEIFWSDSLVGIFESMNAVMQGSAEMATFPPGAYEGLEPNFRASELPLFYNTFEAQLETQAELLPAYSAMLEQKFNQKCIHAVAMVPLEIGAKKKPVKVLADWNNLLTSTISPVVSDTVGALGGVTAPASPIDVYELLQRGTVDATVQSIGKWYEAKLWEVCKYLTITGLASSAKLTTINLDVWNKLPKDIQDIILDEAAICTQASNDITEQVYQQYIDKLTGNIELYFLPKAEREVWQEKVKPLVDTIVSEMGDFGQQVVKAAEKSNAKYPYPY